MNPTPLRRSLGNTLAAGGTNHLNRFRSTHSGSRQGAGRDKARTAEALAAMDCDILTIAERLDNLLQERQGTLARGRHSAIGNRKPNKTDARRGSGFLFVRQIQFGIFILFKEGHDDVKSCPAPSDGFLVQPFSAPRACDDREPAGPRARYPEQVGDHGVFAGTPLSWCVRW